MEGQTAPLYEGLSPILCLWQELIRAWEERQREAERAADTPTHTYAHIIHSERDINPSFRAGDSARGNRFFSIADNPTHTRANTHSPTIASAVQRAHGAWELNGGCLNDCSISSIYLIYIWLLLPARLYNICVCLELVLALNDITVTNRNHTSECCNGSYRNWGFFSLLKWKKRECALVVSIKIRTEKHSN